MNNKSIFLFFNVDWFAMSHFDNYILNLNKQGFDVNLLTNKSSNVTFSSDVNVYHVNFNRSSFNILNEISVILKIYYILFLNFNKLRYSRFEFFTIKPTILSLFFFPFKLFKINFCYYITGLGYISLSDKFFFRFMYKFYLPIVLKFADKIIVENSDDEAFILKCNSNACFIKLPGVGVEQSKITKVDFDLRTIDVLFVARLLKDKGINEFCDFVNIVNKDNRYNIIVLGDVDLDNPNSISEDELNILKKSTNANFYGFRNNVNDFFSMSKFYVLPSYREGFPKTVIEATSNGCISLVSNVPGCIDSVSERCTGFVFDINDLNSLVGLFTKLINEGNPFLSNTSDMCYKYAFENFNSDIISKRHIDFIKS